MRFLKFCVLLALLPFAMIGFGAGLLFWSVCDGFLVARDRLDKLRE